LEPTGEGSQPAGTLPFISYSIFHFAIAHCVYVLDFACIFNSVPFIIIVSFYVLSIPKLYIIFTLQKIV